MQNNTSRSWELRLLVDRTAAGYVARWLPPDTQESEPFSLALPLNSTDMADLRWYLVDRLNEPDAGDRKRAWAIEQKIEAWGRALCYRLQRASRRSAGSVVCRNMDACAPMRCLEHRILRASTHTDSPNSADPLDRT